jgi:glycosyltransferase involved in cell wall biosynthesis
MAGMNKTNPLVSCIIPTKNRPFLVTRAIQSVLGQSYHNIEIIVIDDSTNDETQKALTSLGGQIRYIKNERSRGAPYSRNIGLNEARGDAVTFLDDDDLWLPKKIELQLEHMQRFPIVSCNYIRIIKGRKEYVRKPPVVSFENMLYYNYLGSCSFLMFDASAINECFFDETLAAGQDWDIVLSVMRKKNIREVGIVDSYLVEYDDGLHERISTTMGTGPAILAIYEKYRADHDDSTAKLFYLYNILPASDSFLFWFFRETIKTKLRNKNIGFIFMNAIKRLFGIIEVY